MKIKKYLPLIVAGCIVVLLLAVEVFLLVRLQSRHASIRRDLSTADSNIRSLARRDPFPSEENVEILQSNLESMTDQLEELQAWMMEGQIDFQELRVPNDFMIKLASDLRDLRARASAHGVQIPADFYFSFRRYAEGDMPAMRHVGRLSRQLQMIGAICDILFQGRVQSIESITRQEFDVAGRSGDDFDEVAPAIRGGARVTPERPDQQRASGAEEREKPEGGYAWEEFKIDFTVREPAFWNIMHTLSTTNLLVSVRDVSFESLDRAADRTRTAPGARRGTTGRPSLDAARSRVDAGRTQRVALPDGGMEDGDPRREQVEPEDIPREERVVAGDGVLRVSMTLNMYRFLDDDQKARNGQ